MSFRLLSVLVVSCSIVGLGGCKDLLKKKDPDAAPSATPVVVAPPPTVIAPVVPEPAVPAAPVVDEVATPTPQDFEDEAAAKVTAANFKTELATLKAAITKK